jgi:predicted RNase H-like HicB family nuclease
MRAIVNLATQHYWPGQDRLKNSIPKGYEVFTFQNEIQVHAPKHKDNPYAFKIYAFEEVRKFGFEQILWLDASVYAVKNPAPVFDWIDKYGYFMEESGHFVGQWCNNQTLSFFGITRQEAMSMSMFSAGFTGIDFTNKTGVAFFSRWKNAMLNGMFKGSWSDHRHDMTCGSVIANQMGLQYSKGGTYFAYVGDVFGCPQETAVFYLKGV